MQQLIRPLLLPPPQMRANSNENRHGAAAPWLGCARPSNADEHQHAGRRFGCDGGRTAARRAVEIEDRLKRAPVASGQFKSLSTQVGRFLGKQFLTLARRSNCRKAALDEPPQLLEFSKDCSKIRPLRKLDVVGNQSCDRHPANRRGNRIGSMRVP